MRKCAALFSEDSKGLAAAMALIFASRITCYVDFILILQS